MRGFLGAGMVLVVLDLVLRSPTTRVAQALQLPTGWLAKWSDASVPLIPARAAKPAVSTSAPPAPAPVLA